MPIKKTLNIGLFAFGSDGDIQPLIELASGLFKKGHSIDLAIMCLRHRDYSHLQKDGFTIYSIPYPDTNLMNGFESKEFWHFSNEEFARYFDTQFNVVRNSIRRWAKTIVNKCDLMISIRMMYPIRFCAEEKGIPYVCLHLAHCFIKSHQYPPLGNEDLGAEKNVASWSSGDIYTNAYLLPGINKFRERYTLPPCTDFYSQVHHSAELNLVAFSKHFISPDIGWDDNFHLCGYFKKSTFGILSPVDQAIEKFIGHDDKVISITFGSLLEYEDDPATFLQEIAQSITLQNSRGVILTNKDYGLVSDHNIFYATGYINHQALFSRSRMVIHHGGAGTSHAVAAAGVPSLLIAYGFDQFRIGDLLIKQGICCGIIARKEFSKTKLDTMLSTSLNDDCLEARAQEIGKKLSDEDGITCAVNLIETYYA